MRELIVSNGELTVTTDQGDILIGLGQQWYREQADFVVKVGDQVRIRGYYEDGEFKAGTVENLSLGDKASRCAMDRTPDVVGQR